MVNFKNTLAISLDSISYGGQYCQAKYERLAFIYVDASTCVLEPFSLQY